MKKGTKVSWQTVAGTFAPRGNGVTITDEDDGHVLVAANSIDGERPLGFHPVIYCAVTWLTDEDAKAAEAKAKADAEAAK